MNAEHILDALGLLDDDLVREAEEYSRPKARRGYGAWMGWAASFAVVLVLGYGLVRFGAGSGGGAAGNAPAASAPAASAPMGGAEQAGEASGGAPASPGGSAPGAFGDASPDMRGEVLSVSLKMDEPMNRLWYTFLHWYGKDRTLEELPEGCVSLGKVERLSNTEQPDVPYTDSEEFVGCQAWLLREDPVWKEFKLYVQRPEGGYLECHMG